MAAWIQVAARRGWGVHILDRPARPRLRARCVAGALALLTGGCTAPSAPREPPLRVGAAPLTPVPSTTSGGGDRPRRAHNSPAA